MAALVLILIPLIMFLYIANLGTYSIDSTITLPFSLNFALFGADASSSAVGIINLEDTTNPDALPLHYS